MKRLLLLWLFLNISFADPIDVLKFDNPAEEKRYFKLIKDLRCLKCQNSSIGASNAGIAQDLRSKVYQQITQNNMSDTEIKNWMVARYGDFILYEPPVKSTTIFLWGLPILLILLGFLLLIKHLTKPNKAKSLTPEQENNLEKLLNQ